MASVRGNELVVWCNCRLDTNRDSFLANSEMAKTTNELRLIEGVGRHFHTPHGGHIPIHVDKSLFGHFNFKRRRLAAIRDERLLVKR